MCLYKFLMQRAFVEYEIAKKMLNSKVVCYSHMFKENGRDTF